MPKWGDLLDANTDYVINVSELFRINGDLNWVRTHKMQCERVLGYLIDRDSNHNGLIEVFAGSHAENKGSNWIDVIWASWENALINDKYYLALTQWASVEEIMGDSIKAGCYRDLAEACKYRFNQPVASGGFWSPEHNWYVYWRDKDGSIHGDNLVTPVNFMALAYGRCDDNSRKKAILSEIEHLMQKEQLFIWPISFFPYGPDEGYKVNYPFPAYENGDIFLAWSEVGIRAYQDYDPSIAVKYIKNVLSQYEKDGLAFQRYSRIGQHGEGSDILANNCLPVVGLYRDIYGIQPQFNHLCLDPHLTAELNGTVIKYSLRGQVYIINLAVSDYAVTSNLFTIRSSEKFSVNAGEGVIQYFRGDDRIPTITLRRDKKSAIGIMILSRSEENAVIAWRVMSVSESLETGYEICLPSSGQNFLILRNGRTYKSETRARDGRIRFNCKAEKGKEELFEIIRSE